MMHGPIALVWLILLVLGCDYGDDDDDDDDVKEAWVCYVLSRSLSTSLLCSL
jgi:hypothetical protein